MFIIQLFSSVREHLNTFRVKSEYVCIWFYEASLVVY